MLTGKTLGFCFVGWLIAVGGAADRCAFANGNLPVSFKEQVVIDADAISYEQNAQSMRAQGHVTVFQGEKLVEADEIRFDKPQDTIVANGNVTFLEPSGHVVLADEVTLQKHLAEGRLMRPRILLSDDSKLTAVRVDRFEGMHTILSHVRYTPCHICKMNPSRSPLWSIHAKQVEQNGKKSHIEYHNVHLYVRDTPVLYAPYLRHPDPSVRQLSGFLTPSTSFSKRNGLYFAVPYYWALSPSHDVTLTPHLMTRYGPIMGMNYRQHLGRGTVLMDASTGYIKRVMGSPDNRIYIDPKPRWHIDGKARVDMTERWRGGVDWQRSSDQTYLKNFTFFNMETKNSLNSRVFTEGFHGRHYALMSTYWFQGLGDQYAVNEIPKVLPEVDLAFSGQPQEAWGGNWFLNFNTLSLYRKSNAKVQRAISVAGWKKTAISPLGDMYTLTTSMRGDLYHIENFNPSDPTYVPMVAGATTRTNRVNQWVGRTLPQIALDWRYPWYRPVSENQVVTLQPVIGVVGAPDIKVKPQIPNEDSRLFDFDDSNLFSLNRFSGYDVLDSGSRVNYGAQADWQHVNGGQGLVFLGQSYTFQKQEYQLVETGFSHKHSDYVGRIDLSPHPVLDLRYKFRVDRSEWKIRRSDLGLSAGTDRFRLKTDYFYFQDMTGTGNKTNREQVQLEASSQVSEEWLLKARTIRDLSFHHNKTLEFGVNAQYKNECVTITIGGFRTFYQDAEIKADEGILLKVSLKNLGM